jgi:hypothetical protein
VEHEDSSGGPCRPHGYHLTAPPGSTGIGGKAHPREATIVGVPLLALHEQQAAGGEGGQQEVADVRIDLDQLGNLRSGDQHHVARLDVGTVAHTTGAAASQKLALLRCKTSSYSHDYLRY